MSVPWQVDDGNHNQLLEVGRNLVFPFSDKGDNDSFEAVIRYHQDKDAFRKLASMSRIATNLGDAYLVEHGQCWDQGNGLYEFDRTFASIPKTRVEGASVSFTQQWWKAATEQIPGKYFYNVDFDIEEQQFTVDGEIEYEYFKTVRPDPIIRPRVWLLFGFIQYVGFSSSAPTASPNRIPVEDSEVGIYKGGIYYRKTAYAKIKPST